jgi:hypothetical protein
MRAWRTPTKRKRLKIFADPGEVRPAKQESSTGLELIREYISRDNPEAAEGVRLALLATTDLLAQNGR